MNKIPKEKMAFKVQLEKVLHNKTAGRIYQVKPMKNFANTTPVSE